MLGIWTLATLASCFAVETRAAEQPIGRASSAVERLGQALEGAGFAGAKALAPVAPLGDVELAEWTAKARGAEEGYSLAGIITHKGMPFALIGDSRSGGSRTWRGLDEPVGRWRIGHIDPANDFVLLDDGKGGLSRLDISGGNGASFKATYPASLKGWWKETPRERFERWTHELSKFGYLIHHLDALDFEERMAMRALAMKYPSPALASMGITAALRFSPEGKRFVITEGGEIFFDAKRAKAAEALAERHGLTEPIDYLYGFHLPERGPADVVCLPSEQGDLYVLSPSRMIKIEAPKPR